MMCAVQSQLTSVDVGPWTEERPGTGRPLEAKHQPCAHQHGFLQQAAPCEDSQVDMHSSALVLRCCPGIAKLNAKNIMLIWLAECFAPWTLELLWADRPVRRPLPIPTVQVLPSCHRSEDDDLLRDVRGPLLGYMPTPHPIRERSRLALPSPQLCDLCTDRLQPLSHNLGKLDHLGGDPRGLRTHVALHVVKDLVVETQSQALH